FNRNYGINFDSFNVSQADTLSLAIGYYFWASHYGVDLFFFLSGFLIFKMVTQDTFTYLTFLRRRALRLYPAFTAALALHLAYETHYWSENFDSLTILQNVLFLNGLPTLGVKAIIVQSWSLFFEWAFYLIFPIMVFLWPSRNRPPSIWYILLCALSLLVLVGPIAPNYMRALMFFAGAALACLPPNAVRLWIGRTPDFLILVIYVI